MGFFDKLKMGLGEELEKKAAPKGSEPRPEKSGREKQKSAKVKIKVPKKVAAPAPQPAPIKEKVVKEEEAVEEKIKERAPQKPREESDFEGELAIDVYETDGDFIIQSTIAGVKAEDLDIDIENDMVTVRGSREKQVSGEGKKYYYQECYWGAFSRQVILPAEVDGSKAEASIKDGVLTLKIPKAEKIQKHKISIKQEE